MTIWQPPTQTPGLNATQAALLSMLLALGIAGRWPDGRPLTHDQVVYLGRLVSILVGAAL